MLFLILGAFVTVEFQQYAADVRQALAKAGISLKAAALDMGIDAAQLTRELDGTGHLSARRLACLPRSFHQWFSIVQCHRYGLPQEIDSALRLSAFAQSPESYGDRQ